jgi:hypothetical protein
MVFMEYALQRLPVLVNDLSPLIHNPIVVYSFLGLYGLLMLLLIAYVHAKFRSAGRMLKRLQSEWQIAETQHSNFVGLAQDRLSKLSAPPPTAVTAPRHTGIGTDVRGQVMAMAKRGIEATDIARSCGLQVGDIDVILGMARLQR